jgi:Copper binding proteins, plastocyanin/azurin family
VLVLGLTTGHKVGLLVMAAIFIAFALGSSFLAPRRWPGYPGKALSVFVVASFVLFACMIGAVEVFGGESETASAGEVAQVAPDRGVFDVTETEYRIALPSSTAQLLPAGKYTFHVVNKGKQVHNLTVKGPAVADRHTPNLSPGQSADLTVDLQTGTYQLYCSVDSHRELGMNAKLKVG